WTLSSMRATGTLTPEARSSLTRLPCTWLLSRTVNIRTTRLDVSYTVRVWTFWYLSLTFSPVWDNVWGFDYSPMKDIALTEPLVDTVELKAVVSDPCPIITLDLYTVQSSDLAFKAPFSLPAKRNDFVHALIAWFDIDFTACHKP